MKKYLILSILSCCMSLHAADPVVTWEYVGAAKVNGKPIGKNPGTGVKFVYDESLGVYVAHLDEVTGEFKILSNDQATIDYVNARFSGTNSVESLWKYLLDNTNYKNADVARKNLMNEVQTLCDECPKSVYDAYYAAGADKAGILADGSVLEYYDGAFDRVMSEMQSTTVPTGKVVMWYLYNMGYVVKTPSHTFGIDIKHRRAPEMAPYLDFLLVTHKHLDHYSDAMNEAMAALGKPVYSNFIDNDYKITKNSTVTVVDDIKFTATLTDHSATLINFCVSYNIDCGADTGNKFIFHIGDTYNETQLLRMDVLINATDCFIVHSGIDLNFTKAVNYVKPKMILMSHLNELSHDLNDYRWPYSKGFSRVQQLNGYDTYVPVWGERIVLE